jgi:hypothetical protein
MRQAGRQAREQRIALAQPQRRALRSRAPGRRLPVACGLSRAGSRPRRQVADRGARRSRAGTPPSGRRRGCVPPRSRKASARPSTLRSPASCRHIASSAARRAVAAAARWGVRLGGREAMGWGARAVRRGSGRRQAQLGVDRVHDVLRVGGLAQHRVHAAAARHGGGLALGIHGGVEDDAGGGQFAVGAQALHELVAVHGRHQDVGDDQVRALARTSSGRRRRLRPRAGGGGEAEQGQQVGAVAGPVVDDEDGGHQGSPGLSGPLTGEYRYQHDYSM